MDIEILFHKHTRAKRPDRPEGHYEVQHQRAGDPVEVLLSPAHWGRKHTRADWIADHGDAPFPDHYYSVRALNAPARRLEFYRNLLLTTVTRPALLNDPNFFSPDEADRIVNTHRRPFNFDRTGLPPAQDDAIDRNNVITMQWINFRLLLVHKVTDEPILI